MCVIVEIGVFKHFNLIATSTYLCAFFMNEMKFWKF